MKQNQQQSNKANQQQHTHNKFEQLGYRLKQNCVFEPHGTDVYSTQMLINIQFLQVAIGIHDVYSEIKKGQLHGQKLDLVRILQGLFSIPFMLISIWLFMRFKYAFNRQNKKSIVIISGLMIFENILNIILRFTVGIKLLLVQLTLDQVLVKNLVIPVIFTFLWVVICYIAFQKNGEYGAPPGLLYMQAEQEFNEKTRMLKEDLKKYGPTYSKFDIEGNSLLQDESTYYETPSQGQANLTSLNYEDTEEMPTSEEMDQCYYDRDIEQQPLFQPRDTLEGLKSLKDISFESNRKNREEVRNSCPADLRETLIAQLATKNIQNGKQKQNSKKQNAQRNNYVQRQKQQFFQNKLTSPKNIKPSGFAPSLQRIQLLKFKSLNPTKASKKDESDKISSFSVSSSTSSTLSLQLMGKPKMTSLLNLPQTIIETAENEYGSFIEK